jgi:hypothetical protein
MTVILLILAVGREKKGELVTDAGCFPAQARLRVQRTLFASRRIFPASDGEKDGGWPAIR